MVRERFIQTLNETLEKNSHFSLSDFNITQRSSKSYGVKTLVEITYLFADDYFIKIHVPEGKAEIEEQSLSGRTTTSLQFVVQCEYSPGELEQQETSKVHGIEGIKKQILKWLDQVWEELLSIPVNRELNDLKESVNSIFDKIKEVPNEHFSSEEKASIVEKLDDLETKFKENLEAQNLEKKDLESKIDTLHGEIATLKKTIEIFKKPNWFKSFASRVMSWSSKPENRKMIEDGSKIVKGFLSNGDATE